MKKYFLAPIAFFLFFSANAQIVNIPDANFKAKLLSSYPGSNICTNLNYEDVAIDTNQDGEIQVSEAEQIGSINVSSSNISSIEGIQNFINIRGLYINHNNITTLSINGLPFLRTLRCAYNQMTNLNIELPDLDYLYCEHNQLSTLDLSGIPGGGVGLADLICNNNQISSLNLTGYSLSLLICDFNQLTSLNLSNHGSLINLSCSNNLINYINLSGTNQISTLDCSVNQITSLNLTSMYNLRNLYCQVNLLSSLVLPDLAWPLLRTLNCSSNYLTSLDLIHQPLLTTLDCSGCDIQTLDLSNNSLLNFIQLNNNNLSYIIVKNINFPTSISIANNPNLSYICADNNDVLYFQSILTNLEYTNCVVNSDCVLSTSDITNKQSVILFPNPVISTLNIDTKAVIESITIYNSLGQVIKKTSLNGNIKRIDIEDLMIGNYFVKIVFEDGDTLTQKIIKE